MLRRSNEKMVVYPNSIKPFCHFSYVSAAASLRNTTRVVLSSVQPPN